MMRKKTILVYGHSIGFPWDKETGFQHDVSVRLIKKANIGLHDDSV